MPRREPSILSEEQARRLWERAAQLQAEATRREELPDGLAPGSGQGEDDGSGYSVVHVRQAALEAGIRPEFVELALAEEAVLEREGGARERGWDRAARRFLGRPEDALEVRRWFPFPAGRVWPALERTLGSAPHDLELLEMRGGDPRVGGVAIFEVQPSYQDPGTLRYTAGVSEVRRFLFRLIPDGVGSSCSLLVRAPLRRSRRVNLAVGAVLGGVGGLAGGGIGLLVAALTLGSGGAAAGAAAVLMGRGVFAGEGLLRKGYRALYGWGLAGLERALLRVLSRVERELEREEEGKRAVPPGVEPPEGQAG